MNKAGRPPSIEKTTLLSKWFDNHPEITREGFAAKLGIDRQHVDRYARGERRPGLDTAFDIEDITAEVSGGSDILKARDWVTPRQQRSESSKGKSKQKVGLRSSNPRNPRE